MERLSEAWEGAGRHRSAELAAGHSDYSECTPTQHMNEHASGLSNRCATYPFPITREFINDCFKYLQMRQGQKWFQKLQVETDMDRLHQQMRKLHRQDQDSIPLLCQIFIQQADGTIKINPAAWHAMNEIERNELTSGKVSGMVVQPYHWANQ